MRVFRCNISVPNCSSCLQCPIHCILIPNVPIVILYHIQRQSRRVSKPKQSLLQIVRIIDIQIVIQIEISTCHHMRIKHKYPNNSQQSINWDEQYVKLKGILNVLIILRCLVQFGVKKYLDVDHPICISKHIHIQNDKTDDIDPESPRKVPADNRLSV